MNGTRYEQKSFSVPASSAKSPENCLHGWVAKNRCVLCGYVVAASPYEHDESAPVDWNNAADFAIRRVFR